MAETTPNSRGQWGSRLGFVLAAAGSAVGLGNLWKFPYITGENGGGLFVLIYLVCIVIVGLPVMMAEIVLGRATMKSPVGAFRSIPGGVRFAFIGWMGVLCGFIILSYYSVVAGWSLHYILLSASGAIFADGTPEKIGAIFGEVYTSAGINLFWHLIFMGVTIAIVVGGVAKGIERASKVLMPALLVIMTLLMLDAVFLDGFGRAISFLFSPNADKLTPAGVLEALGHSFFTLSLGMGAMLTYGSYLDRDADIMKASAVVSFLDTLVALLACMVMYPIIFSFGMEAQAGPGLVFKSIPIAFSQMTGGTFLSVIFFVLVFFAALSSAISLLEVVVSTLIDEAGLSRGKAAIGMGAVIFLFGVPSALSGSSEIFGDKWASVFGKNFFDTFDYLASNWLLPLGGLFISIYVGWFMPDELRREELVRSSSWAKAYDAWLFFIKFVSPVAIFAFFTYTLAKSFGWL